jgi:hypothetical protein
MEGQEDHEELLGQNSTNHAGKEMNEHLRE